MFVPDAPTPHFQGPAPARPGLQPNKESEEHVLQQTTNFQLNQWEPEDRILRTDFNNDNLNIDAALKTSADAIAAEAAARKAAVSAEASARSSAISSLQNQVGMKTIRTITTSADAAEVDIPLSGVSWSGYKAVHFWVQPQLAAASVFSFRVNGLVVHTFSGGGAEGCRLVIPCYYSAGGFFAGINFASGGSFVKVDVKLQSVTKLELVVSGSGAALKAGTKITILGEK